MNDLVLLRPLWLIALPVLVVLGVWLMRRPARLGAWAGAVDPGLMAAMARIGRVPEAQTGRAVLWPLAAAGCVAVALAGPAIPRRDAPAFRNLDGVVLVMDLSPSMEEDGQLEALITAARVVLARLGSRPAGLVVYAGDAFLAAPLTTDTRQLGLTVALLEADMITDPGSRPGRGLAEAIALLQAAEIVAGDVVLFTDGGGIDAETEARAGDLPGIGARLWALSVGAPSADLTRLAALGGGGAYAATEAAALTDEMARGRAVRLGETDIALLYLEDLGRCLLIPALLLAALTFRRQP